MRVLRGRAGDPKADAAVTRRLVERVGEDREPALRVWQPARQCSFGRRDVESAGYERAREIARNRGYPPSERRTGGRAVPYSGTTVAIALAEPVADIRGGLDARYDVIATGVQRALWRLDVPAQRGEPEHSFCPGGPSLQSDGKVAGFAQRVQRRVALVGGIVIVDDHEELAAVIDPIYEALEVPFDPDTVGSIERSGGRIDGETVLRTIEGALLDDREAVVERIDQEG